MKYMKNLFSPIFDLMEKGLNGLALRQQLLSNNLANVNTPGFKRSDLDFDTYLKRALQQGQELSLKVTDSRHIRGSSSPKNDFAIFTDYHTSARQDGNNVNMDTEMVRLAENSLKFNAIAQQLNRKFAILKHIIIEGRR